MTFPLPFSQLTSKNRPIFHSTHKRNHFDAHEVFLPSLSCPIPNNIVDSDSSSTTQHPSSPIPSWYRLCSHCYHSYGCFNRLLFASLPPPVIITYLFFRPSSSYIRVPHARERLILDEQQLLMHELSVILSLRRAVFG